MATGPQQETPSGLTPDILAEIMRIQALNKILVSWVNQQYNIMNTARMPYERQWHINLAFTNGRQNISPVTVAGSQFRLTVPKAPPWRVRLVINKIRTAVRTECSKLTSSKPIPVCIPATTEDEDLAASRVAETILRSEFANEDTDAGTREWVWWGVVCGNSFMKSYWDPSCIDERAFVTPQPPVEVQVNPKLMELWQKSPMSQPVPAQGKIIREVISPFHMYVPDLISTDLEKQPYIMHVSVKTPEFISKTFGVNQAELTPDSRVAFSLEESAILTPVGATNQHFDACLVKEVWVKPGGHPAFPKGGLVTVAGDKVIQLVEQWPVPFYEYPFYAYEGIPTGAFYKASVVEDLIPVQKEYNRTRSQAVEIKNMVTKPKIMAPKGSINPRMINSDPGQAILYTPGFDPPQWMNNPDVPASYPMEIDRLTAEFDDISGQHEITRGNTPSQVTSGTAISFLQEQDESKLHYQVAGIERATAKYGRHYLKFAVVYWQDGRLVKIVGKDGDFEAKHWQTNAMEGNTDVIVQAGSGLPTSKAAKQALITDLMAQGFIDPTAGLEVMDLQSLDKILEDFLIDKRHSQRENLKMSDILKEVPADQLDQLVNPPVGPDGEPTYIEGTNQPADTTVNPPIPWQPQAPFPVNSWDNHEIHIRYHNQFRKTQTFEMLPEDVKKVFELHVQTHQMAMGMPQVGQAGIVANQDMVGVDPNAQPADPNAQVEPQEQQAQDQAPTEEDNSSAPTQ